MIYKEENIIIKGEGEMYGKSNMETYNTMCKIDSQWRFVVWLGELKQGLYQSRGVGWGDETVAPEGGDMGGSMADSCWCLTENNAIL